MKAKETWINETINSLDGIERATASSDLLQKIQTRMVPFENTTILPRRSFYWSVAASIIVLIALNIFGAIYYQNSQSLTQAIPVAVANDYLSYLKPINL
jgi:hypothetical protein